MASSATDSIDGIAHQVERIAATLNEVGRQRLLLTLRDLGHAIETPRDTMARKNFAHLQIVVSRVASELRLYELLAESNGPLTIDRLSEQTGADPMLLGRLLRYMAAQNDILEVSKGKFTANEVTKTLASAGGKGGIYLFWDSIGPAWQALPDWLREHNYTNVDSVDDTPHQKGHNTSLRAFAWAATVPEVYSHSHQYMKAQFVGLPTWLDVYPLKEVISSLEPDQVLFVDVGGGIGHQCIALLQQFPGISHRVILQDTPDTVAQALEHESLETMAQDFFTEQKCRAAKIYYLRNVIHDYNDVRALEILGNIKAAMAPSSVILIDDMVLPNTGVHWHAAGLDLAMMCATASLERTKEQWESLIADAGLTIRNVYPYTDVLRHSIIECVSA